MTLRLNISKRARWIACLLEIFKLSLSDNYATNGSPTVTGPGACRGGPLSPRRSEVFELSLPGSDPGQARPGAAGQHWHPDPARARGVQRQVAAGPGGC